MKKFKISIFMIFLIMILAVSAVSAADVDGSSDADLLAVEDATVEEVVTTDDAGEVSTAANDAEIISADDGITSLLFKL